MLRLASVIYAVAGTTVAGSFIVAALVAGYDTLPYIVGAAGIGFVVAMPVAYFVAKAIRDNG